MSFGHLFTDNEKEDMQRAWRSYFVGTGQMPARNGMLWFCLTQGTARSSGTQVFFELFGGEAVFMPLKNHPTIAEKLRRIGQPVIVEARLPPGTTAPLRLALPLLSAYHRTVRLDAHVWEAETNIRQSVPPADILAVTPPDFSAALPVTGAENTILQPIANRLCLTPACRQAV